MTKNITTGIDWLQGTVPHDIDLQSIVPFSTKELSNPSNGYTHCIKYDTGTKIMSNAERLDMGNHLVMSGDALRNTRRKFVIKEITMVREFVGIGGRLSRIDLYLDVFGHGLDIKQLSEQYSNGQVQTRARKGSLIEDLIGDGMTLYVGKRGSRKFLRIYDKAAESGKSGDWKRIEIELRKDAANAVAAIITNNANWAAFVPGIIDDFAHFPSSEIWKLVMKGVPVEIGTPPLTVSATEKWLLNVCAPALGRLAAKSENHLFERFVTRSLQAKRERETAQDKPNNPI